MIYFDKLDSSNLWNFPEKPYHFIKRKCHKMKPKTLGKYPIILMKPKIPLFFMLLKIMGWEKIEENTTLIKPWLCLRAYPLNQSASVCVISTNEFHSG